MHARGRDDAAEAAPREAAEAMAAEMEAMAGKLKEAVGRIGKREGVELGPIALSFQEDNAPGEEEEEEGEDGAEDPTEARQGMGTAYSETGMSTEEWRARYEKDGAVDLWVEEEFNAGSRLVGGRAAFLGREPGQGSGEGPGLDAAAATTYSVTIRGGNEDGSDIAFDAPDDRYLLFAAEAQGFQCPNACRNGCCTACTMRVVSGDVKQEQALGLSKKLREDGYVLTCVAFPRSDLVLEPVLEEEAYQRQFGAAFDEMATDPENAKFIERDDFALEIADCDE